MIMRAWNFLSRLSGLRDQCGFSLVEVIVAIGISSVVVLGTSSLFLDSAEVESGQERQFWIAARRMEFQSLIRTPAGWASILIENPSMSCLAANTSCAAFSSPQPLKLPAGGVTLDGSNSTVGMTNRGDFCSGFDSVNGNGSCPVGLHLNWVALCDDTNCLHAQPKITIKFRVKEPVGGLQNLSSFDLVVFKDPKLESLNEICTSMGGVIVGTTCSISSLATACDPSNSSGTGATYPTGFNTSGAVICGKPTPGTCASTDVATGFGTDGGILCAPACL